MAKRDLTGERGQCFQGDRAAWGQKNLDALLPSSFLNLALQASNLCLGACLGWEMTSPYSL